jgi:YidC/Oxa1 family membrane protein insertase
MNQQQPPGSMHPQDMRNLIIFVVASILLWLTFDHFILEPRMEQIRKQQQQADAAGSKTVPAGKGDRPGNSSSNAQAIQPRRDVLKAGKRIPIESRAISGSLPLTGKRLNDIELKRYKQTVDGDTPVVLFAPAGTERAHFAEAGWITGDNADNVPGKESRWQLVGDQDAQTKLTPDTSVTMRWRNEAGVVFERTWSIDKDYLVTLKQRVINKSGAKKSYYPYALITRHGKPDNLRGRWIMHEGPIGYVSEELHQYTYGETAEAESKSWTAGPGWLGITQKYWLAAVLPDQQGEKTYRFVHKADSGSGGRDIYQTDVMGKGLSVAPGESVSHTTHFFTGAKKVGLLDKYENQTGVPHLDLAVDFGWFYFMTKPFHTALVTFYDWTGNFGIAIILLTIILRAAVFPLANTSYKAFAKLRQVQPQMMELREKYGDDKQKLQQELVKLYEREKVNPMAGCLPILVQIPIFFAMYKVVYVAIEMRHAPFFGWIEDLSAPDPTSVFNLFGLIPVDMPSFLQIGAWPCMMLAFLLVQQRLNPPPQDPTQKMMMKVFPFMITFILSRFASGLVVYWTTSNFLSIVQQYIIMKRMGVEVSLFNRPKGDEKLEEQVEEGPAVHPETAYIEHEVEEALFGDEDSQADSVQAKMNESDSAEQKAVSKPRPKKKKKK